MAGVISPYYPYGTTKNQIMLREVILHYAGCRGKLCAVNILIKNFLNAFEGMQKANKRH